MLSPHDRANVISTIAEDLIKRKDEILLANKMDLDKASAGGIKGPMFDRLVITQSKLESLSTGLLQISGSSHNNVGRILRSTKVSDTLNLVQKTVPIGIVLKSLLGFSINTMCILILLLILIVF